MPPTIFGTQLYFKKSLLIYLKCKLNRARWILSGSPTSEAVTFKRKHPLISPSGHRSRPWWRIRQNVPPSLEAANQHFHTPASDSQLMKGSSR